MQKTFKYKAPNEWNTWFAWHPVLIKYRQEDNYIYKTYAWLETVLRKRHIIEYWVYKPLNKD